MDFEGEYLNQKKHGKVKEYDCFNGSITFEGEYLNGKRNGKGKEYKDGKLFFEGEYLNDERNGFGKEYDKNGKIIFEGEYINGKRVIFEDKKHDCENEIEKEVNQDEGNNTFFEVNIFKNLF